MEVFETADVRDKNTAEAALLARFSLNEYLISPASGEVLLPDGTVLTLEPKVMQVLLVLTETAGNVISAEQLFARVWPKSIYSPVSVRRSINQLRKVFNDTNKVLISTHPKRGYALHAAIALTNGKQPAAPTGTVLSIGAAPQRRAGRRNYIAAIAMVVVCALVLLHNVQQAAVKWQVSELQPVTATAAQESFSIFTPDSQAVIYVKQTADAQHMQYSELWLTSLDRTQNQLLYRSNSRIDFFAWLPTSADHPASLRLLVASQQADTVRFVSLTLSDDYQLQARSEHFALPDTEVVSPFFSVGTRVFFLAQQQGNQKLYQANLASGQLDLLLSPNHQFSPYRIAASADEDAITVLGFDQQQRSQIKLLSTTTAEISDVKTLDANWYFIAYNKAFGGYLLSDGKGLFALDEQQQLTKLHFENYAFLHYPALSPTGRQLSYTQAKINGNIFSLDLTGQQISQLSHSTMHDWQGSFSADNRQLAYVSNKHGHSQVFVLDLATNTERLVYDNQDQQLALSQPVWSADTMQLAFARNQRLVIVDLAAATPQVQHFDQVIGVPTQWLDGGDSLLIRQASQPLSRWFTFAVASAKQQHITASNWPQVLHENQRFEIGLQQIQDADTNPVFVTDKQYRIAQHFAKNDGIYLLLRQPAPAQDNTEVWFFAYASQSAEKISAIRVPDQDISDISQQQLLYSSFSVEKDIHTLKLTKL
ncbi:winged helix-turn-helix domain-containing protein [Rheinheimera maricola]|uniref:Winged helix-turn-helix domain-containing protein n=1 Tax=Rheinheimera maricola TaxID=2793282 RepID=A0ABS7X9Q4_9GAMM|nr:winged helix-turn-helix domain-containing protein [Rheinheimera maricola]MBZ9612288.1 winged helix-turn-helix domain-containing protein [Rheinheimera maricola]